VFFALMFSAVILASPVGAVEETLLFSIDASDPTSQYVRLPFEPNKSWYDSNYWSGPEHAYIGSYWMHPGANHDVVRVFQIPRTGKILVGGTVKKLHLDGDGVKAAVFHNEKELWKKEIEGNDSVGVNHLIELDMKQGDLVRFQLSRRGNHFCDTTAWSPTVTYLDGVKECFSATDGFSGIQGNGHWFYERLNSSNQPPHPELILHLNNEQAYRELGKGISCLPDFDMLHLLLAEWLDEDRFRRMFPVIPWEYAHLWVPRPEGQEEDAPPLNEITPEILRNRAEDQLRRTHVLIDDYGKRFSLDLAEEKTTMRMLGNRLDEALSLAESQRIYVQARLLKRSVFLKNPEFPDAEVLFLKRYPPKYSHQVGQHFGWWQQAGGGLYVLEKPGYSLKVRGPISRDLPSGTILEPRLSFDASRIVFSFVEPPETTPDPAQLPVNEEGNDQYYYHLYEMNVDGSGLRQLTAAKYDDLMPEYLPDGGLAFVSTRRRSYMRCSGYGFAQRWHVYTLFRMNTEKDSNGMFRLNPDDIQQISFNDVNEWYPTISHAGQLLFARWDYIDRDAVTHQNLWAMRPNGTNPVAVWGNASPKPHCTFQTKAIPGSDKFVFIASPHHSITAGPVCLVNPAVDANSLDAITRITPGIFPEAEGWYSPDYYQAPFPFSERLFMVAYSPCRLIFEPHQNVAHALGLYLLDDQGNRELLYRDLEIGATNPQTIQPRPVPPVLSSSIDSNLAEQGLGEMSIVNVYEGLPEAKSGSLKQLRIVQVFPKTQFLVNIPQIGIAGEENTRAVLGVVPIEKDGSAKFLIPAKKPFYFQVLDEEGFAYQTMRSSTSVMPGEKTSCIGCHENQRSAASRLHTLPIAFSRPASRLQPTPESGRPYGFVEMIQPILNAKCIECHQEKRAEGGYDLSGRVVDFQHRYAWAPIYYPVEGYTASYVSLTKNRYLVPRFEERNQIQQTEPGGKIGARGSGLIRLLKEGHHNVVLTSWELERIGTWLDLNAIYYGAYEPEAIRCQQRGEQIPMPLLE
jgi:hypothetical protein